MEMSQLEIRDALRAGGVGVIVVLKSGLSRRVVRIDHIEDDVSCDRGGMAVSVEGLGYAHDGYGCHLTPPEDRDGAHDIVSVLPRDAAVETLRRHRAANGRDGNG